MMDHYNGDQVRDRSRGSERDAASETYGRLNGDRDGGGYGRGWGGRSPGEPFLAPMQSSIFGL
jgi:hypothetical protein